MNINFENIRKGQITKDLILTLLEKLYLIIKSEKTVNIVINEFVENMSLDESTNIYSISLINNPLTINDILIYSENGEIVITPKYIQSINKNEIKFSHPKIKNKINFFVTYKY